MYMSVILRCFISKYGLYIMKHEKPNYHFFNEKNLRKLDHCQLQTFVFKLLQKDKNKRLGAVSDVDEIKSHNFFRSINWTDLEAKIISPPYNPNVRGQMDLKNIDPEFIREPVPASLARSHSLSASVQDTDVSFVGFSYAPPNEL